MTNGEKIESMKAWAKEMAEAPTQVFVLGKHATITDTARYCATQLEIMANYNHKTVSFRAAYMRLYDLRSAMAKLRQKSKWNRSNFSSG